MAGFDRLVLRSLAIGFAGGGALTLAGLPGGWVAGSMLAVAVAALSGVKVPLAAPIRNVGFLVVGIAMGSGVTPETIARLPSWPITLAMVVVSLPVIVGVVYTYLNRMVGWNRATAFLSSLPGALSFLVALAPSTDADVPRVAIVQSFRVAMLVALLPIVALFVGEPVTTPLASNSLGLADAVMLYGGGIGGAILAHLLGVPGGLLVGGLFVSALLHGSGAVVGVPPDWLSVAGFVILGTLVGSRFTGTSWSQLGSVVWVSLVSFVLSAGLAASIAIFASWITGLDLMKLILALAPGGLEVMVVLAFALDLDPAFVAAHHLARFLLIALTAPFLLRLFHIPMRASNSPTS
ncbi:MAG: AbrB family transcriptional regulator [Pseudomonadota bacterium]